MHNPNATLKQPLNPLIRNALIMLGSGLVASVLCAKVYAAPLAGEAIPAPAIAISAPAVSATGSL